MIELFVYDSNLNIIGEISEYESLEIERNYTSVSKMTLRVLRDSIVSSLLSIDNTIVTKDEMDYGYVIQHFGAIKEENSNIIEVYCYSLNFLLTYRSIQKQQRFTGDATRIIENFVRYNCINVPSYRVLPNLTIGNNALLNNNLDSTQTGGDVLSQCFSVANDVGASIDVSIENGGYVVKVWRGLDRSSEQNVNARVTFSQELENVLSQNYYESNLDYKNVAVVAGQGEGINRVVVETDSTINGLQRRELYVDARDLSKTYIDENDIEITLTDEQYRNVLIQRGLEKLKEYIPIKSFETTADNVQYIVGIDYFLGDKVTFVDTELGITLTTRVTSIKTISNRNGVTMMPSFGTGIPNKLLRTEV